MATRSPVELDTATGWALRPGFSQSRQCPCGCFVNKSGLGVKCRLNRVRCLHSFGLNTTTAKGNGHAIPVGFFTRPFGNRTSVAFAA